MSMHIVTAAGRIILGPDILQHLGVGPGDRVSIDARPDGRLEIMPVPGAGADATAAVRRREGCAHSIDDIDAIAADGWARRV